MKKSSLLSILLILLILTITFIFNSFIFSINEVKNPNPIKITILYDNYTFDKQTKADWGFSCLIEGTEKKILFDTGTKPDVLQYNLEKLQIDTSKIDLVVISHNHRDHTMGLPVILKAKSGIKIFFPLQIPSELENKVKLDKADFQLVDKPMTLCSNVRTTGVLRNGINEQSLLIDTPRGLVVITGCAHPGIINILKKTKEITGEDIYAVLGGFHLLNDIEEQVQKIAEEMKYLGVKKCGAGHCTGDSAIGILKKTFGIDFIETGTGKMIIIE